MKFKKGLSLGSLPSVVMSLVLIGVFIAIGAYVLDQINTTGGFTAGGASATAIGNATTGLSSLAQWLPNISIVIAAGIVIYILVNAFSNRGV